MSKKKRQTGRTTRMMQYAVDSITVGKAVYVILANKTEVKKYEKKYADSGIKFETVFTAGFDWETMTVLGAHPDCVFLVDHYAIEDRYRRILYALERWDERENTVIR